MEYMYLPVLEIPQPYAEEITDIAQSIQLYTQQTRHYIFPHVTIHRPLVGISEKDMLSTIERITTTCTAIEFSLCGLCPFGKDSSSSPRH